MKRLECVDELIHGPRRKNGPILMGQMRQSIYRNGKAT